MDRFHLPTIFVLFGITGDLVRKKILISLFKLYTKGYLSKKCQIYGFARRDFTDETLREYLKEILVESKAANKDIWDDFLSQFYYVQGTFDDKDAYSKLAEALGNVDGTWNVCSNKLYYLAVPPDHYEEILRNIETVGLTVPCSEDEGWTRVILEKPFGSDLQTAIALDKLLGELFREEQVYRVDHYLAKETVRNILAFRFSNSFLDPAWNAKHIEKVEILMHETLDVSKRADFYDKVGAFRDFGKNHMLQLLALATMEDPLSFEADAIRTNRAKVFTSLKQMDEESVKENTARAQYKGYLDQEGVDKNSKTETYFRIETELTEGSLKGIPIILEHGKALKDGYKEIRITFKQRDPCLCGTEEEQKNVLHYHIAPDESIIMTFFVKRPGHDEVLDEQKFGFTYDAVYSDDQGVGAYEEVLKDIIEGDQTLFVSTDEIIAQWKFVEPILRTWDKNIPGISTYEKGTNPADANGKDDIDSGNQNNDNVMKRLEEFI